MKKLFTFLLLGLFLISFASAWEFDNKKSYNPDLKEVTIENALGLGGDVAKIKLTSPLNFEVPRGYQKVAEFELTYFMDDNGGLDLIKFYDIKESMSEINRKFDYKIKEIEEYEVNNYETICENNITGNGKCVQNLIGTHTEEKIVWNEFDKNDLKKEEKITIGIFTDVQVGDVVEWIPTFYGVEIKEWATWTESLNANIEAYYKLDEASGNAIDSTGTQVDGVSDGIAYGESGIIGDSFNFTAGSSDEVNLNFTPSESDFSINMWVYFESSPSTTTYRAISNLVENDGMQILFVNGKTRVTVGYSTGQTEFDGVFDFDGNEDAWHMITVTYDNADKNASIFIDGNFESDATIGGAINWGTQNLILGNNVNGDKGFPGRLDEVGIWSRELTPLEISDNLWNGGAGNTWGGVTVTLNYPVNDSKISETTIEFNCSAEILSTTETLTNMSLYTNESGTWEMKNITTGLSTNSSTQTWSRTLTDGSYIYSCKACATNDVCSFATWNYTFMTDTTLPSINITYPTTSMGYGAIGENETFNWTATDTNIDTCWYQYNNTNTTVTCGDNTTSFILVDGFTDITFYVNDSAGNENSTFINWTYKIFENNRTHNSSTYETAYETYTINITANASLTAVNLLFNGTPYVMTEGDSGIWSYSRDLPSSTIGNNSINFSFTYAGSTIYTDTLTYQYVNYTSFGLCNATLTDDYLNISFKDESNSSIISASISTSTFEYYLGNGDETKTYQLINNTANTNYTFCAIPNRTFHVDPYVQYVNTGYPQRIWDPDVTDYTSVATNQTLYLLSSTDGIYENIQVINSAEQPISGATIVVSRYFGTVLTIVATGVTADNGVISMWLNPDYLHYATISKTGYTDFSTTFFPLGLGQTINIGGATSSAPSDYNIGMTIGIEPTNSSLLNGTAYDFNFILSSTYWDVEEFGFVLKNSTGSILGTTSESTNGGTSTLNFNTGNNSNILMYYYWVVDGNYTNGTSGIWYVSDTEFSEFSLRYFFTDLNLYIASGLFGLDNFGLTIFLFLLIFISTGIMSYKFGLTSPAAISVFVFTLILFLDVGIKIMENVNPVGAIPHFITVFTGIIMIGLIWEAYR